MSEVLGRGVRVVVYYIKGYYSNLLLNYLFVCVSDAINERLDFFQS